MLLVADNVWTQVTSATTAEETWIYNFLTFDDAKGGNPRWRKPGQGPPKIRLYSMVNKRIPSGLLPLIQAGALKAGVDLQLMDRRAGAQPAAVDLTWLGSDARGNVQRTAVARLLACKRGILWAPTGLGKTEIAVALAQSVPCPWLFLVPGKDLLHQTAERWQRRTGEPAGRVGDGCWSVGRFTVATFQTLYKTLQEERTQELLAGFRGMIVDECHVLPSESFLQVAAACPAYYRFGVSGTPLARGDRRSLMAVAMLGPVVHRVKFEELAEEGILARPRIRMIRCAQAGRASPEWHQTYARWVAKSDARNAAVIDAARRSAKPALLFVRDVKHGMGLARALRASGVPADFVWGDASKDQRAAAVKRLVRGDTEVLVCSTIFQQGVDIPSLASIIVASGGASTIASIQRVGRGMRTDGGRKSAFEVWDIWDVGIGTLERHAKARRRAYLREGYEVLDG